ncbi:uncharacterized protein METZ01_LOCUS412117 [marine metagenome]|uniref:Uncharacterized protein n=1 Tax=marine metagenome TaxID=408172 RepID=A0A382WKF7_9ZZZZ
MIRVKSAWIKPVLYLVMYWAVSFGFMGCAGFQGVIRKTGPKFEAEVQSWQHAIESKGGNGMWLVSRGYRRGDDLVAISTFSSYSHVGILDREKGEVIESLWGGNVVTPLDEFLHISHRVVLVQPESWTPEKGGEAIAKARAQLGKKYDFGGLIGLPSTKRWYCSELAAWSWGWQPDRLGPWHVIHPRRHLKMGSILFESGARDGEPDKLPAQPK